MMPKTRFFYPYQYGTVLDLGTEKLKELIGLFETPPQDIEAVLSGRAQVVRTDIEPVGSVVIKYYKRGGMIRHILKNVYLRWGTPRSRLEFDMLAKVRGLGIRCPEPLIWAIRGGMLYRAFLVTGDIGPHRSLADLSHEGDTACAQAIEKAAENIHRLVSHRIHHVDLHPGNILVDEKGSVFIIDFDKAYLCSKSGDKLLDMYLRRWKRAVLKHSLPPFLDTLMAEKLSEIRQSMV